MTSTKRKTSDVCSLGLSEDAELFLQPHTCQPTRRTNCKLPWNGMPWKCYHGKPGGVYSVTQHAADIVVNRKFQGMILVRRITMHPERIIYSESPKNVLNQKRRKPKKKAAVLN